VALWVSLMWVSLIGLIVFEFGYCIVSVMDLVCEMESLNENSDYIHTSSSSEVQLSSELVSCGCKGISRGALSLTISPCGPLHSIRTASYSDGLNVRIDWFSTYIV